MKRFLFACALLIVGLGARPALADAPPAAGPDFQVSVVSQGLQLDPDVAQDTAGNMVAVWTDLAASGAIKARLFTAAGAPRSGEITVEPSGASPRVAMTPLGDFVVVWESREHIYLRHFDPRGETPHIVFDPLPEGISHFPDVAMDPAGNAYVVWADTHFDGDTIMFQRYGPDGFPVGLPEQVNQPAPFTRGSPRIAADAAGNLLVSWSNRRGEGGFDSDVWARRFNALSGTWGPEARVNADKPGNQEGSASILYPDGTGAVVFYDLTAQQVLVRDVDAAGNPTGVQVKLGDLGGLITFATLSPAAAAGPDGTALVAWQSGDHLVHARFFDRSWSALGGELTPSSVATDLETDPAVAAGGLGNFAAVWTSNGFPSPIFP
ncbi:MAG TPA: hypothetical protein VIJ36_06015, partial [Thermoanaerobaculia bacterium]